MSHEATHVATGAWDSRTPLWLLEGFADYVALRDVDLPVQKSAAQIIAAVRRDGAPRELPDAAAFGARTPHLGATYESAWLAVPADRRAAGRGGAGRASTAPSTAAGRSPRRSRPTTGLTVPQLTARVARPPDGPGRVSDAGRRVALVVTAVGGLAFVVLAVLLVPWHPVPGGTPDPAPARRSSPPSRSRGARTTPAGRGSWSWSSLAVSLVVACVARLQPLGPAAGRPAAGLVVGAGGARRRAGRCSSAGSSRCRSRCCCAGTCSPTGSATRLGRVRGRPGAHRGGADRRDVGAAASCSSAVPGAGSGRGRRSPAACSARWCCSARSSTRCSSSRSSTTSRRCPTARCAPTSCELAEREGVPVDDVLVADASRRTTTLNAYVSGFGSTRRVVLYDNLVDDVPQDETLSVVAHELAHARHDDVLHRVAARRRRRGLRRRPAGAGGRRPGRAGAGRRCGTRRRPAGAGAVRDRQRCSRRRCRTRSAARSRPGPTSTPCAATRDAGVRSRRCSASSPCARSPTRRRRGSRSSGSGRTRPG